MKRFMVTTVLIATWLTVLPAYAGDTGKISGRVTDGRTGEPIVGANVVIVGTGYGASSGTDGEYFILRIPPGVYRLRGSAVGYQEVVVRNVTVAADLTTRISFTLEEQAIEGKEIVVTAARPVIQKDATASTQFVDAQQIARLPVQDAKEGVFLQAGVFFDPIPVMGGIGAGGRGEPRYSIRGGAQDEVKWYIDGVRTAALIEGRADRGGSFTNVNANAIQEIQIQTSGYSAEFGDAQSGIVNVVTKEGGGEVLRFRRIHLRRPRAAPLWRLPVRQDGECLVRSRCHGTDHRHRPQRHQGVRRPHAAGRLSRYRLVDALSTAADLRLHCGP